MAFFSTERVTWMRKHQRVTHGAIALFWAVVFIALFYVPGLISYELHEIDLRAADDIAQRGRLTPSDPNIVFLGIDDASLRMDIIDDSEVKKNPVLSMMANGWPWDHRVHAAILDRLIQAGARVVIFDIIFTQAKPEDPIFRAALDRAKGRVLVGCNYVDNKNTNLHLQIDAKRNALTFPSDSLISQVLPLDSRLSLVNFWPGQDNVIRQARFYMHYPGASLGEVESKELVPTVVTSTLKVLGKEEKIPSDTLLHWFRFTGSPGTSFQSYPIYQLFFEPDWESQFQGGAFFKDKIVIVGPKGNFQQDSHNTPFGPMDGSEVHLQALNAALNGELLFYTGDSPSWLVALVFLGGFIAWLLGVTMQQVTLKRVILCALLSVLFALLYFYAGLTLYSDGIILAVAAPIGTLGFTLFSGLGGQYILEHMDRERTRRIFERYVSAKVVKEVVDNPSGYYEGLKGKRRPVAILFSDLRGFTSMTESADSEQLVRDLNEYLEGMTRALFQYDGMLDKFIGDAVMAVWGNLQPKPEDDARHAVLSALAMHRELVALNILREQRGSKPLAMGVGINHGEAIVGDIGSDKARNFTVIGDPVNLASRLEGATKDYGVGLLISETVEELVRPFFHLQTVDSIVVKGRVQPVKTYTVVGLKEEPLSAEKITYLEKFEESMKLYRTEKFDLAREGFSACLEIYPDDKLSKIFKERSTEFIQNPPPQPWDGSYTMKTK